MHILLALTGAALLALTLTDVIKTTIVFTDVGGPLTRHLARAMWRLLPHRSGASRYVGPLILLTTVVTWLILSWLAWLLIFYGASDAVINAQTKAPADFASRLYFAGFSIFTLGVGDFVPNGALWQVLTVISAAQGFFVITLSITFILPVVTSVTERRQLASQLYFLGKSPADILVRHWNGRDFGPLEDRLLNLLPHLVLLEQRHFTYPVLHYFIERDRRVAAEPNIVVLDEALGMLEGGLKTGTGPSPAVVADLRKTIGEYLDTLREEHIKPTDHPPPQTSLEPLRRAELPTSDETSYTSALARTAERRALLYALLKHSGWAWEDL